MSFIDQSTPFGQRAERRLRDEPMIWLTTVRADGTPQPSPVWFLWDGESALIYSQPDTPKVRAIRANPRVSLHLDGDGQGGDIVILGGEASVDESAPPADQVPDYLRKYAAFIERLGWTPQSFAADYSLAVRVRPRRLRGH